MKNIKFKTWSKFLGFGFTSFFIIILLCMMVFCQCSFEKDIQVRSMVVTVKDVNEVSRHSGPEARITWEDERGLIYYQFTGWPTEYSKGYKTIMLITK